LWRKQQTRIARPPQLRHESNTGNDAIANGHGVMPSRQAQTQKTKRLNQSKRKQMEERSREIEEDIARARPLSHCETGC